MTSSSMDIKCCECGHARSFHGTDYNEDCSECLCKGYRPFTPPVSEPSLQGKIKYLLMLYHYPDSKTECGDLADAAKAILALVGNEEKLQPLKPLPDTHPSKSPLPDTHPTPTPPPTQWEEEFEEKFNHGNYYTFEDGDATGLKDFIRSLLQKQRLEVIDGAIEIVRTNSKLSKKYDVSGIRVGYEAAVDDLISELTDLRGGV